MVNFIKKNSNLFLLFLLALIWGSSYILIKKSLVVFTALQVGAFRIIFAALFVSLIGFKSVSKIKKEQWKHIFASSGIAIFTFYLPIIAQKQVSGFILSILNSLLPLYVLFIAFFVFNLTFVKKQIIGIIIGLSGTFILIFSTTTGVHAVSYYYILVMILASLCFALNIVYIKKYLSNIPVLGVTVATLVIQAIPSFFVLYVTDVSIISLEQAKTALFFVIILGIVCTGVANLLYYKLSQVASPVFAASVTYLIPLVAFMWSLLDGDHITSVQCLGALIILVGVYLSNKK